MSGNAECFPFRVTGVITLCNKCFVFLVGTSLLVTMMQRRWPPSSALRRLTACRVVPEPAKKSTISALGLSSVKKYTLSFTAYSDLGNELVPHLFQSA